MRLILLAAAAAIALASTIAFAQVDGPLDTSARGSVRGLIDTQAGGLGDQRVDTGGLKDEPPRDVVRYVRGLQEGASGGGALGVNDTESGADVHAVPGNDKWGYAVVNGQAVIVNRQTETVAGTVG